MPHRYCYQTPRWAGAIFRQTDRHPAQRGALVATFVPLMYVYHRPGTRAERMNKENTAKLILIPERIADVLNTPDEHVKARGLSAVL